MTATVRIETPADTGDRWEPATYTTSYPAVRGIITNPQPNDQMTWAGDQSHVYQVLHVDLGVAVNLQDRVTDLVLGDVYEVTWVHERAAIGLAYVRVGLKRVSGVAGS